MSGVVIGGSLLYWDGNKIFETEKEEMPVRDLPEKEQEFIRAVMEAQNINAYKEALQAYYGEDAQVPQGNAKVVTIHGMGSKIFVGNEAYVPEAEVPAEVAILVETKATSIDEAKDIVENYIGRDEQQPDVTSLENREEEQRGNIENNEMTRAQRASLER